MKLLNSTPPRDFKKPAGMIRRVVSEITPAWVLLPGTCSRKYRNRCTVLRRFHTFRLPRKCIRWDIPLRMLRRKCILHQFYKAYHDLLSNTNSLKRIASVRSPFISQGVFYHIPSDKSIPCYFFFSLISSRNIFIASSHFIDPRSRSFLDLTETVPSFISLSPIISI